MRLIAAVDSNWAIGYRGKLLVSIPADQKFFRSTTTGGTVIMGRKTLEDLPGASPLKNRRNIVLTQDPTYSAKGAEVVHSVEEALDLVKDEDPETVFCIGGASIYRQMLPYADTCIITAIDYAFEADAYFPNLEQEPDWELEQESDEQVYFDLTYHFQTWRRISGT